MTLGIMQPYFLPYIGYFQLVAAVDEFVVYDDIEYTKRGWINRNRFLQNGRDEYFTVPLRRDSDSLDVRDRMLAETYDDFRSKTLRRFDSAYRAAPYFAEGYALLDRCLSSNERNLFGFLLHSIAATCEILRIGTPIIKSSDMGLDRSLKGKWRVLSLCHARGATKYLNPIGGADLYDRTWFAGRGVELCFIRSHDVAYKQLTTTFIPHLSIVDVIMFNGIEMTRRLLHAYDVV